MAGQAVTGRESPGTYGVFKFRNSLEQSWQLSPGKDKSVGFSGDSRGLVHVLCSYPASVRVLFLILWILILFPALHVSFECRIQNAFEGKEGWSGNLGLFLDNYIHQRYGAELASSLSDLNMGQLNSIMDGILFLSLSSSTLSLLQKRN